MAGILGCILGLLFLPPLVSLIVNGFRAGFSVFSAIGINHLATLVMKTALLAAFATTWATILALPFAWLVVRTNIPWRGLWRWVGTIPLAIPSYIGALTYITLLGPAGLVNDVIRSITSDVTPWVNIYGFWGGVFVLGSFTYPIMFLFLTSALEHTNPALEEAASSLGLGRLGVFRLVTFPLLRPTMLAGGLLIFLYAISDFGALSLLRVQVLTTEIYHQLNTRFDQTAAALLSCVLVVIAIIVLIGQRILLGRKNYTTVTGSTREPRPLDLGPWRWLALTWILMVLTISFFLPLGLLVYQSGIGSLFVNVLQEQWPFMANSLWIGALTATLAISIGAMVAYISQRLGPWAGKPLSNIPQIGYAIPGTVLGLSLILLYNTYVPWLYGSVTVIILAYLIRFLTQAVQGSEAALISIHRNLEEAARSLGTRAFGVVSRVVIPITKPALFSGWALVFISAMKELDATLLLRPAGFDTIPVRIYIHTVEAEYSTAAVMSIVLIAATAVPWLVISTIREKHLI